MRKIDICGYVVTIADDGATVTATLDGETVTLDRASYLEAIHPATGDDEYLADLAFDALASLGVLFQSDVTGQWTTADDEVEANASWDNEMAERRAYRRAVL